MKYKIDVVRIRENSITLNGWVIGRSPESRATFRVEDDHHRPVKFKHVSTRRDDVSQIYFKRTCDREFGFDIQFPYERGKDYWLLIRCEGRQAKIKYNESLIAKRASVAHKRMEKIKDLMNMETVHVALDFWKEHGLRALVLKSRHKLAGLDNDYDYGEWYDLIKPTEEELENQRNTHFAYEPLLSVVIPAYKTPERYLREMLDSILAQTYTNWEVCIADGSPRGQSLERILQRYAEKDSRIRFQILGGNRGIAGNTNAALEMARGDYVILADHDDTLPSHAFYEVAKAVNEHPDCDVIYSDEDKLDMDGKALFDPHFKPDFNGDLLTSVNYICHLFIVKKELLKQVGGFRQEFDGAQDYDFIFRCTEAAKGIHHIPKVLYHWRCHQDSTASNPESKMYAFEAGSRAIMAHYERMGIRAEKVEKGVDYGIYHTTFRIQGEPLISVIIPNKDHRDDLDVCVRSLLERSSYRNLEFIVVENNSTEPATFAYYEKMQAEHPNFHVVTWEKGFNYSAINNFGTSFAKGEYLLLLNNDTELIEPDSIKEMLGFCQREDVGIAGARLLYGDDTIQHAGVVIGFGGIAGHTFIGLHKAENSYFHRAMCAQDYSAVTAACLMTKKSVFEAVGGLSEELAVAFNDIDYCMKVRALGKLVVYAPYACLYHYESKSRGLEDTPQKVERFNREVAIFIKKWPDIIREGDPYYNPNLTLRKSNFALRDLLKEKIGEPYDLAVYDKFAPEEK
ncbi:glycosyltransferase family 2 protein [Lacrimispora sp. 210928-DFI.3.58]|uniref:glycosyltransferase family 2 protein n=1 Tax=Lacrimispora sp. 210928-DFI.3.58 TaxID=2883214 RepID=UPI001D079734|nr:glycosyltransferase family 2 protein [Lacrimispora sp. 210928-DFI.3.58]MCB7319588.1 glycosyltransferase family 2 protein [Lacrimispora sp. 210928-DFI.3.58]